MNNTERRLTSCPPDLPPPKLIFRLPLPSHAFRSVRITLLLEFMAIAIPKNLDTTEPSPVGPR